MITREDLRQFASAGESETVEFKRSTGQLTRVGETLCAMLNAGGGAVLVGVTDEGEVVGQNVADTTLRAVAAMLAELEPDAPVRLDRVDVEGGRQVLVLRADPRAGAGPWVFRGRPWQRVGTTSRHMPPATYQRLILHAAYATHRWELSPAGGFQLDDLDSEEILRTVRLGIDAGRLPEDTGDSIPDVLRRLDLLVDGQLRKAALVLFARRPAPEYPQCALRLARFVGVTKEEFSDERQVRGHAFVLLSEAMAFMLRHIPIAGTFPQGEIARQDRPIFPVGALREAVVNALIHRDYSAAGGAVSVAIFDDRLEVWSTGCLPEGLTPDALKRDHLSEPPNPTLADVFYRRGLIEQWGRGTQRIVRLCVHAGNPEPEFEEVGGAVCVRFLPKTSLGPGRVPSDLTERQAEILAVLRRRSPVALRQIKEALSEPPATRTLQDDLERLRARGLVGSGGRGRGARWWLKTDE